MSERFHNIGKPFTPSVIVVSDEQIVTSIKLSCGGGMGGASWTVYTTDEVPNIDKPFTVTTIGEQTFTYNPRWVVSVGKMKMVSVTVKNLGNENCGKIGELTTTHYFMRVNDNYAIYDDYCNGDKLERNGVTIIKGENIV